MKVLLINAVCGIRSTGRICVDIAQQLEKEGHTVKIAYSREDVPEEYQKYAIRISNRIDVYFHALMSRLFDEYGYCSRIATKKFLKWADDFDPDVLWLHNIHDYTINITLLFKWIKRRTNMQVKWTQHDCWAFTGGCMHFTQAGCYKWKSQCQNCIYRAKFPKGALIKRTRRNFLRKKESFSGIQNMRIITVSHWLENLVRESFLGEYPIGVCYNKVDENVFTPTDSDFREKYGLENKKIVLGVATFWTINKGLLAFNSLSEKLSNDYKIVLVGVDKKMEKRLNSNILCLPRTNNPKELAQIYTAADLFLNLSVEETFGMTTLEALNCGTKAVVLKNTACEEIANEYGGVVVERDIDSILKEVIRQLG